MYIPHIPLHLIEMHIPTSFTPQKLSTFHTFHQITLFFALGGFMYKNLSQREREREIERESKRDRARERERESTFL